MTGVSDELIKPQEHPYYQKFEQNSESFTKAYAEYLSIAHEEDLELFRSEKSHIGDETFISSIISTIGARLKLKVGRPRKRL